MRTRDGVELESYGSAMKLFQRMAKTWAKGTWVAGGYRIDEPGRPDRLGDPQWPAALRSIDDWIESALKGKIIAEPDHDVLRQIGRAAGRERGVDLGGRRFIQKTPAVQVGRASC